MIGSSIGQGVSSSPTLPYAQIDPQATRWAGAALALFVPLAIGLAVSLTKEAGPVYAVVPLLVIAPSVRWGGAHAPYATIDRETALEAALMLAFRILISSWELLNASILVLCACAGPIGAVLTTWLAVQAVVGFMAVPSVVVAIPVAAFFGALAWAVSLRAIVSLTGRHLVTSPAR